MQVAGLKLLHKQAQIQDFPYLGERAGGQAPELTRSAHFTHTHTQTHMHVQTQRL